MSDINRTSSVSAPNYTPIKSEKTSAATKTQASTVTLKPQSKGMFSDFLAWLGFSKIEKADSTVRKLLGDQAKERASQYEWKPSSFFLKGSIGSDDSSSSLISALHSSDSPNEFMVKAKLIADKEHYQKMLTSYQDIPEAKEAYTQAIAILDKATGDVPSLTAARHAAATVIVAAKVQILAGKIVQGLGEDSVEAEDIHLQAREAQNTSTSVQKALKRESLDVDSINEGEQKINSIFSQFIELHGALKKADRFIGERPTYKEESNLPTDVENRTAQTAEAANVPLPEEKMGELSSALEKKVDQFIEDTEQERAVAQKEIQASLEVAIQANKADSSNLTKLQERERALNKQIRETDNSLNLTTDRTMKIALQSKLSQLRAQLPEAQRLAQEASAKAEQSSKAVIALQNQLSGLGTSSSSPI